MGHEFQDRVSLEIARRVAAGLDAHPEWMVLANENLDRWSARNSDAPSLLRCYAEWRAILQRPVSDIRAVLLDPSDEGQRLRQNSPFVGVLSSTEIWDIKRRFRDEKTAA